MKKKCAVILLALIITPLLFSQTGKPDTVVTEKPDTLVIEKPDTVGVGGADWFAYPYIFYSPETNLAFGGGGIVYFKLSDRTDAKSSSILLLFITL